MLGKRSLRVTGSLLLMGAILAGCSGGGKDEKGSKDVGNIDKAAEPVELTVYYYGGSYGEEQFKTYYGNELVKKYPHISFRFLQTSKGGGTEAMTLADAVSAGATIDILYGGLDQLPPSLLDYNLAYDHAELIKKHKFDLNSLLPQVIDMHKSVTGGVMYGLPVGGDVLKFLYNRDLFDKFGVPYPKAGITWDEVFELTKRMSRFDNGVQYRGAAISFEYLSRLNQFGLGFVDPKTSRALFTADDRWQRFAANLTRFYNIAGNEVNAQTVGFGAQHTAFTTGGTVAMDFTLNVFNAAWTVNWDIAKFPVFPDKPRVGSAMSAGNFFAVTSTSKHKDEAFKAVSYLSSKEFQLWASRNGTVGVLNDPEMKNVYGKDVPWLQERKINIPALFPDVYADTYPLTVYDKIARDEMVKQLNGLIIGTVPDINTALRQSAESANKLIDTAMIKSK